MSNQEWPRLQQERLSTPFRDHLDRIWRIMERPDGSIALCYTKQTSPGVFVVYDSLNEVRSEADLSATLEIGDEAAL